MAANQYLSPQQFGFAGGVSSPAETPWVQNEGRHVTLAPEDWAKMPVESVSPHGMFATQDRLRKTHLNRYRKNPAAEPADGGKPWVVEHQGKRWVLDGHHRVAEAGERGSNVDVHMMRLRD